MPSLTVGLLRCSCARTRSSTTVEARRYPNFRLGLNAPGDGTEAGWPKRRPSGTQCLQPSLSRLGTDAAKRFSPVRDDCKGGSRSAVPDGTTPPGGGPFPALKGCMCLAKAFRQMTGSGIRQYHLHAPTVYANALAALKGPANLAQGNALGKTGPQLDKP